MSRMRSIKGWGEARVFREAVQSKSASGETFISVHLEFQRKPNGHSQRVEFRSWAPADIARLRELVIGATVTFRGEIDAQVMIGADDRVFANPRITGQITKIVPPGGER